MDGNGVSEVLMIVGVSLLFCPSLLALPVRVWAAWHKPIMGNKKLFLVGMGLHVLGILIAIGVFGWLKYVASDCHGCVSGLHLFLMLPITWLLFVCGAICNGMGWRQPKPADGHSRRIKKRKA